VEKTLKYAAEEDPCGVSEEKGSTGYSTRGPSIRLLKAGGRMKARGFTLIESLLVIAIIGIIMLMAYPNIKNSLEVRSLENEAREILTTLQQAKFQAVRTKLNHRVNFDNSPGYWVYYIEREVSFNNWVEVPGTIRKSIPNKLTTTINLPGQVVVFSPLGFVLNYSTAQHDISVQSTNIQRQGQPSTRIIVIYAGGSIQFTKSS
jgi:prepilin-type N-terminal cleavage/methylation domain-containing protein